MEVTEDQAKKIAHERKQEAEKEAFAEAKHAEAAAVKAIESAIMSRLACDANRDATEKAKAVVAAATQQAMKATEAAEKAVKENDAAAQGAEDAKAEVVRASEAKDEADAAFNKAKQAKKTVAQEMADLEVEAKAAKTRSTETEKAGMVSANKAREAQTQVKYATRAFEKAQSQKADAETALGNAEAALWKAEKNFETKSEEADAATAAVYPRQQEEEELADALATAERAANEYIGTGSTWEVRTQETLKERRIEYRKAKTELDKVKKQEDLANVALREAQATVDRCKHEKTEAIAKEARETAACDEAEKALAEQTIASNQAQEAADATRKDAADALAVMEGIAQKVKQFKQAASGEAVAIAEEQANNAKEAKENAERNVQKALSAASAAQDVMGKALAAKEAAMQTLEAKQQMSAKALEKENESENKKRHAESLVEELENKVRVLANASLEVRGVEMNMQEAKEAADAAKLRREEVIKDARMLNKIGPQADKVNAVDKWRGFRRWCDEDHHGAEIWNVRRLFYALDGSILSSLELMVKDIVGAKLERGAVAPKLCKLAGDGLTHCSLGSTGTFNIQAYSTHGVPLDRGGDNFQVGIRFTAQGMRVRSKVVDHDDGTYTVTYKPTSSGKILISVSVYGEALPDSPYVAVVSASTPSAAQCFASGEALTHITAHKQEKFSVGFRDVLGQVTHAGELDVWVHPVGGDRSGTFFKFLPSQVELSQEVAQLLENLGEFDHLCVGPKGPLEVSRTRDEHSEKIEVLQPGREVKLLQVEPPTEDGVLRACVIFEKAEPTIDYQAWRELWPQQQEWRSTQFRTRTSASREHERAMAKTISKRAQSERAAKHIQASFRGKKTRAEVTILRQERDQRRREELEAAQRAAEIAAKKEAKKKEGEKDGGKDRGKARSAKPKGDASPAKGSKAEASPAGDKKKAEKADKGKKGEAAAAPAAEKPKKGKDDDKKSKEDKEAKEAREAKERQEAEEALAAEQALAATKLQASTRGHLERKRRANELKEGAGAPAAAEPKRSSKKGGKNAKGKGSKSKGDKRSGAQPTGHGQDDADGDDGDDGSRQRGSRLQTPGRRSSPKAVAMAGKLNTELAIGANLETEGEYGWITLAVKDEPLVTRQTGRLPAHIRQQHMQHWNRRVAIDSERERERAIARDKDMEWDKQRSRDWMHTLSPLSKRFSPRPGYAYDVEADPKGVGFAYGGVYPGRLHAHGKLFEQHDVNFSVAQCGTYLLYVGLRPSKDAPVGSSVLDSIPGSPFLLQVSPGPAHPLGTMVPPGECPMVGGPSKDKKGFSFELTVPSRDKMGNKCTSGGAVVTCGFLDSALPSSPRLRPPQSPSGASEDKAAKESDEDAAAAASAAAAAAAAGVTSSCVDNGDGTYTCKWERDAPGLFNVFIKMDGLHIIGSPTTLKLREEGAPAL